MQINLNSKQIELAETIYTDRTFELYVYIKYVYKLCSNSAFYSKIYRMK